MAKIKKNIAILGTRGVPASYGGFETFAEELGQRLAADGYEVQVYCRYYGASKPKTEEYKGMQLIHLRALRQKYLETPLHSLCSFLYLIKKRPEIVLLCNAANSPFAWIVRLLGISLVINVDGIERKRAKWNCLGKLWYLIGEVSSVLFASKIVADADVIAEYYQKTFSCKSNVIAYGAVKEDVPAGPVHARFGLIPGQYLLFVSRLEPENNALGVIEAYKNLNTKLPLVVVGDAPYAAEYKQKLFAAAEGAQVIFTGFQFGQAYKELRNNCYLYVQATEVGGTHPALVEAMAYGNCIVANDVPEHREVLQNCGLFYQKNNWFDLAKCLQSLLENPELVAELRKKAASRAAEHYTWERVTEQYKELFAEL